MTRCVALLLQTTYRKHLLSLLRLISSASTKSEYLFAVPTSYEYCRLSLQSLLLISKHSSDLKDSIYCLYIILSFALPPVLTDSWLSLLVDASIYAIQFLSQQQIEGFRMLHRLLVVDSKRVMKLLELPYNSSKLSKAVSSIMRYSSHSELLSVTLKFVGALGGWIRDKLDKYVTYPVRTVKEDSPFQFIFQYDEKVQLTLSKEYIVLECLRVLSDSSWHIASEVETVHSAKRKAFCILLLLFDDIMRCASTEATKTTESDDNVNHTRRDREVADSTPIESSANTAVDSVSIEASANTAAKPKIDMKAIRIAYLYAILYSACNSNLREDAINQLKKCADEAVSIIKKSRLSSNTQNSDSSHNLQFGYNTTACWTRATGLDSFFPSDFSISANLEYDFVFFASLRLLQSNHKEAVDVVCQWLSMLFERIQEELSLLYSFCDNMLAMLISYGLEGGWKLETKICCLFNVIIKKLPIDWCNRVALIFLHFFVYAVSVRVNLIFHLDSPC